MLYTIKKYLGKIARSFEFMKMGWNNEDWDYDYLLDLIEYKAKRIAKHISEHDIIIEEDQNKIVQQVEELCEHIKNYRNPEALVPEPFEVDYILEGNGFKAVRRDTGDWKEEDEKVHTDRIKEVWKKEDEEWHAIWQTLDEHARGWWD